MSLKVYLRSFYTFEENVYFFHAVCSPICKKDISLDWLDLSGEPYNTDILILKTTLGK